MNKNLLMAGIVVGVLMISLVSAGWFTGNAVAGDGNFCTTKNPCVEEQGDCDKDKHCTGGLICVKNVGATYGFDKKTDVCLCPAGSE